MRYSKTEQHLGDQNYVQIQVQIQDDNVNSILYLQSLILIELIGLCACHIHHIHSRFLEIRPLLGCLLTKYWKCLEKICCGKVSFSWHFLSLPIIAAHKRIYDANKALNNGKEARS